MTKKAVLHFISAPAAAGFPSPAEDFYTHSIDLNKELIQHPSATFLMRASGNSMEGVGIYSGDILIVDRAITPKDNHIIVAAVYNEMMVKRVKIKNKRMELHSENKAYEAIMVNDADNVSIWGVVTYVIHQPH